jgi:hypothetical protein
MPLSQIGSNAVANNSINSADIQVGLTAQFVDSQSPSIIYYNGQNVTSNIVVTATLNGFSAGPITINDGQSVTVNPGGVWTII